VLLAKYNYKGKMKEDEWAGYVPSMGDEVNAFKF
jgi:hypothetical protein